MSLIAIAYCRCHNFTVIANIHMLVSLALVLLRSHLSKSILDKASELISSGAVVSTLLINLFMLNPYGTVGAVLYILAGLVIGTDGYMSGTRILRVDAFHYVLVIGNISLMLGLTKGQAAV